MKYTCKMISRCVDVESKVALVRDILASRTLGSPTPNIINATTHLINSLKYHSYILNNFMNLHVQK